MKMTAGHREEHSTFYTSSSTEGSQKDITLHAEAIIMYFGLNCNKKGLIINIGVKSISEYSENSNDISLSALLMNGQRILLQYISLLRTCTHLNTLHGTRVVSVEDADLLPVLRVPDVDPSVARTRDDELRVGGEGGLQRKLLGVQMSCEDAKIF